MTGVTQRNDIKMLAIPITQLKLKAACLLVAVLLLGGCSSQRPLMPTPDVYALGMMQPFADSLPTELKTVDANIMYVTDRIPAPRDDGRLDYGLGRAYSVAVGEAVVNIGGDISWEALAADASSGVRPGRDGPGSLQASQRRYSSARHQYRGEPPTN